MRNIIKEMGEHCPEAFLRFNVLLAASLAKASLYDGPAIKTIFFLPFMAVRHVIFLLKISTNTQVKARFLVYYEIFYRSFRYCTIQVFLPLIKINSG